MAINIKTVTCPACGARVDYDDNNKTAKCEFCGAVLDMTEEYGDKKDRVRDDIQDMQIKNIMNKMNGRTSGNNPANVNRAKKTAIVIIIVFVFILSGSITYGIIRGSMMYNDKQSKSGNNEIVNDVNPFEKVSIKYYGVSGKATARINDGNTHAVSSIEKSTTNLENLSNGDTITVKYTKDTVTDGNKKYNLLETEKTFTVNGLDEYVTDIAEVGEKDLAALKKNAISLAISECKDAEFGYVEDTFDIYAVYTMVKKDYSDQKTVFIVSFDYKDSDDNDKVKTGYFMAEYSKATKLGTGEYKVNFSADVYSYMRESYFKGFTVLSAHSTWDAVYTEVYLNNKSEWNIKEDIYSK